MSYKVINAERGAPGTGEISGKTQSCTTYTIERTEDGFKFLVLMWDSGMFSIKSLENKQIGYSDEFRKKAMEAINNYKLKQSVNPDTLKTLEDLINDL